MKILCAWCEQDMGEKPPYDDPGVTHSICDDCLAKQVRAAYEPAIPSPAFKKQLLERLKHESED